MSGIKKKYKKEYIIAGVILVLVCCMCGSMTGKSRLKQENVIYHMLFDEVCRQMEKTYFMLPVFLEEGDARINPPSITQQLIEREIPLYGYLNRTEQEEETEDAMLAEIIKSREGADEDARDIEESRLDYGEDALHIENSMVEEMQKENDKYKEESAGEPKADQLQPMFFSPAMYPAYTYDWSEQWEYEDLVSNFYAVDNTTVLKEEYLKLDELLYSDLSVNKGSEGPQILIYHTHSQEEFADSIPGDASTTIVGAGEKLAEILVKEYGFKVLHHTGEYDVENRDYAYNNSLPALEQILEENPTIEVVIDLHRDEMKEGKKLVMDLQGRPTARFMFFNGMSHIRDKGDISYLENPYIQENLAFSFQTQVAANEYYPGIARRIYLKAYRYNMHLKPKSMLIELGAQTNTVEEIMNACDPLAHIISIVLGG